MVEFQEDVRDASPVAFLLPPGVVPVIDIFRALGDFEEHYDVAALDHLEERLADRFERSVAKGLVSDALLLAFGLRRERMEGLSFSPVGTRRGTLDEYRLTALISAAYWHDFVLASEAAAALNLFHAQPLISLAFDIARRLEAAGMRLELPNPALLGREAEPAGVEIAPASGATVRKVL